MDTQKLEKLDKNQLIEIISNIDKSNNKMLLMIDNHRTIFDAQKWEFLSGMSAMCYMIKSAISRTE